MKYLIVILFSVCLISCKKNSTEGSYNFKGVVIDYVTGNVVPNVKVSVVFTEPFTRGDSIDYSASGYSNANGFYQISLENNPQRSSYFLNASENGYSKIKWRCEVPSSEFGFRLLEPQNSPYFDTVYVDKSTYVNIKINNILPSSINDTLDFQILKGKFCPLQGGIPGSIGTFYQTNKRFYGIISNKIISDTFAYKSYNIYDVIWQVKNNGVVSKDTQRLVLTEYGITNFNLNY